MDDYSYSFYNPHNARFYFNFNKWNFRPLGLKPINSGHEFELDSFEGCRIVVKRSQVEITNRINTIRKFTIIGSDANRADAIVKAASILELECIDVLRKFISKFGGSSDFVVVSRRIKDNKILHDEIIDSIPLDAQWNDDVSKKVYNANSVSEPRNVEFKKEVYAQNYVRNAGLRLFAPEIHGELQSIHSAFDKFTLEALNPLTEQIKLHLEVQRETLKTLTSIQGVFSGLNPHNVSLERQGKVLNILDSNSPLFPCPDDNAHECRHEGSQEVLSTFPLETLSRFDVESKSKAYRLFRARQLLNEYGWSAARWN